MIAAKINYEYNYDFYEIFVNNYSQQLLSYLDSDIYKKVLIKTILLFYSQYFLYRRLNHISIDNLIEFDSSLSRYLSYRIIRPIVILPRWAALIYGVSVIALSRIRYGDIFLLISKLLLKSEYHLWINLKMPNKTLTIVSACYNEAEIIQDFYTSVKKNISRLVILILTC